MKNNVVTLPLIIPKDEERELLDNATACTNCGKKLFYILKSHVVCYRCKTAFELSK